MESSPVQYFDGLMKQLIASVVHDGKAKVQKQIKIALRSVLLDGAF